MKNHKYLIVILLFFLACNSPKIADNHKRSMYIWTANTNFSDEDMIFFRENNIKNVYIRFFDVDWNSLHGEVPISIQNFNGFIYDDFNIIPVIFIKNEVFKELETENLDEFANKLHYKIDTIFSLYFKNRDRKIQEIQLDCDWTETTKDKYFELIKILKTKFENVEISVTIRLHQIKYQEKTGVPPAHKGVLMYYNMGNFLDPQEPNSILNNEIGKQYIDENSTYPLELSLALPIYSWSLWYQWGEFEKIMYDINIANADTLDFLYEIENNTHNKFYEVNKDTYYNDKYFRAGDIIKLEIITVEEIEKAKEICKYLIKSDAEIILFSYSSQNSNLIKDKKNINKIYK